MSTELNPSFFCPISAEVMVDPVIDREGNSYERKKIEEWIRLHKTSPITRNPLELKDLAPNRALKEAIQTALALQGSNNDNIEELNQYEGRNNHEEISPIQLSVFKEIVSIDNDSSEQQVDFNISLKNNEERSKRVPSDIIVVIDVSGSMSVNASVPGVEDCMLSILDIVKHAVTTIIHTLDSNDRLAIVKFSNVASTVLKFTHMNESGKTIAEQTLKTLQPDGMTNIWDALQMSLNILKENKSGPSACYKNSSIILLTDGEPNINPPRGIIPMLEKFYESHDGRFYGIINTFGFGYSLDSKLLYQIASMYGGMYAFIPDSGFVGTVFVNALANTLVTIAEEPVLEIVPSPDVKLISNNKIELKSIQSGQSKDVIVNLSYPIGYTGEVFKAVLAYYPINQMTSGRNTTVNSISVLVGNDEENENNKLSDAAVVASQKFRISLAVLLLKVLEFDHKNVTDLQLNNLRNDSLKLINDIKTWLEDISESLQPNAYKRVTSLLADLEGEVIKALSNMEWFNKWGYHYLLSLKRAHELQQCNNFKDPGVQHYGGITFKTVRDFADDKFCQLPPPVPAPLPYDPYGNPSAYYNNNTVFQQRPIDMSSFNSRDAPCFHESCVISLADGQKKGLSLVKRGDILLNNSIVECVLRTKCLNGEITVVSFEDSGLLVTPWHPVVHENDWKFPYDIANKKVHTIKCEYVYSFLIKKRIDINSSIFDDHIIINGVKCLALGHNIMNHPIASHSFFGTNEIVKALMKCNGYIDGVVTLDQNQGCCIKRNMSTGLICDIIEQFS